MIEMQISCHAMTHHIYFGDDRASAESELAKLLPLLGRDKWGSNGKGENPTHTIKSPTGDVTVVLEKVEVARILDNGALKEVVSKWNDEFIDKKKEQHIAYLKQLNDLGLLKP